MEITEGSLTIGVSYHGFPIYTETKDLCQQTECPVKKGPVNVYLEEPFPVITPPVSAQASCVVSISWRPGFETFIALFIDTQCCLADHLDF